MPGGHDDVVRRLAGACATGDIAALEALLDPDALAVCDGGGRVPAVTHPVHGAAGVARLALGLLSGRPGTELSVEHVNGQPGLALRRAGRAVTVVGVGFTAGAGTAAALWIVLNPAKLRRWHRP